MESMKKELLLDVNSFNLPAYKEGVNAKARLFINLLFLKKGTYPSTPDMGVDIKSYQFDFLNEVIPKLTVDIQKQVEVYLPELTLDEIKIQKAEPNMLIIGIAIKDEYGDDSTIILKLDDKADKLLQDIIIN